MAYANPSIDIKKAVIFAPQYNSVELNPLSEKKADASEFRRGAGLFAEYHGIPKSRIFTIDNSRSAMLMAETVVYHILQTQPPVVAFFCHATSRGIQFGIRSPGHPRCDPKLWARFLSSLSTYGDRSFGPITLLYACSTGDDPDGDLDTAPGSGNNSFADLLRDGMCRLGFVSNRVYAHVTTGHSWHNPMAKMYDGAGFTEGGEGADLIVTGWKALAAFKRLLEQEDPSKHSSCLAWELPFMSVEAIRLRIAQEMQR